MGFKQPCPTFAKLVETVREAATETKLKDTHSIRVFHEMDGTICVRLEQHEDTSVAERFYVLGWEPEHYPFGAQRWFINAFDTFEVWADSESTDEPYEAEQYRFFGKFPNITRDSEEPDATYWLIARWLMRVVERTRELELD